MRLPGEKPVSQYSRRESDVWPHSKLSVYATATVSNYHAKTLPFDFYHPRPLGSVLVGGTNTPQEGVSYPYVFNSIDFYVKYVFYLLTEQIHISGWPLMPKLLCGRASHETEPDLLIHTSVLGRAYYHFSKIILRCRLPPALSYLLNTGNTYDVFGAFILPH